MELLAGVDPRDGNERLAGHLSLTLARLGGIIPR
jgi:hypothetical protein